MNSLAAEKENSMRRRIRTLPALLVGLLSLPWLLACGEAPDTAPAGGPGAPRAETSLFAGTLMDPVVADAVVAGVPEPAFRRRMDELLTPERDPLDSLMPLRHYVVHYLAFVREVERQIAAEPTESTSLAAARATLDEAGPRAALSQLDGAVALAARGHLWAMQGDSTEAAASFLEVANREEGVDAQRRASYLLFYAAAAADAGESGDEVVAAASEALQTFDGADPPSQAEIARAAHELGRLYVLRGEFEEARPLYQRSREIVMATDGEKSAPYATELLELGRLYISELELELAREPLEHALALREALLGPEHPATLDVANELSAVYFLTPGQDPVPLYERILASYERGLGADHPATVAGRANLERLMKMIVEDPG